MTDDKTACTAETHPACPCEAATAAGRLATIETDHLDRAVRMQPDTALGVISFWLGPRE